MILKYALPAAAALALGFAVLSVNRMKPEVVQAEPPQAPPSSPFDARIGATGIVETRSENISIGVPVSGLVMQVMVRPGDAVRRGQPLLTLDGRDLQAELALREAALEVAAARLQRLRELPRPEEIPVAEARLAEARAQLGDARTQLRMMESVPDRRAVRLEDLEKRRKTVEAAAARVQEAEAALALLRAGATPQELRVAGSELEQARRQVERVRADLSRLTVAAPIAGRILQVNIRPGEYAAAGPAAQPLILMGSSGPLYVRAEVDEKDAWRLNPGSAASASVRGNSSQRYAMKFVRIEPYVVPKRNLTGDAVERVDTRVLQVLYELPAGAPVYAGQRMDVFIESRGN